MSLSINISKIEDIDCLMKIYEAAVLYMRKCGNLNQWTNGYPSRDVIIKDIIAGVSYTIKDENEQICGVFSMIPGLDPTYGYIEGKWIDDTKPYLTIHRIASNGRVSGIAKTAFDYAVSLTGNVRVDTHKDNAKMQEVLISNGFEYCGIIYLLDGNPRLAYQYVK